MFRIFAGIVVTISICYIEATLPKSPSHFMIQESLEEYQNAVLNHLLDIFCKVRAIFVNVSIEKHVPIEFANRVINTLSHCLTSGITISG